MNKSDMTNTIVYKRQLNQTGISWLNIYSSVLSVLAVLIIASIGVYCFSPALDSDMVEGLFWSEAAISGNGILNSVFVYSYAIPFGANLMLIPFIRIFGMTQLANSFGMLCFYLIIVATGFILLKELGVSYSKAIIGTAVLVLVFRSQIGVNLLHHTLFYQIGLICYMGLSGCLLHCIKCESPIKKRWYILLFVFALWNGSNGVATIMLSSFPVVVSLSIALLCEKIPIKNAIKLISFVVVGVLVGYGIYILYLNGIQESSYLEKAGSYSFASTDSWIENLREMPKIWLDYFMVLNPDQKQIVSPEGFETLISIVLAIICAAVPFAFVRQLRKLKIEDCFIFIGSIIIWAVCIIQYVFVRKGAEDRLIINGFFTNFILLSVAVCRYKTRTAKQRTTFLITAILLCAYSICFPINANWTYHALETNELEARELSYGLASSFWDAGINTVNTEGKIKIRPVTVRNGAIIPWEYQTKYSWYDKPSDADEWFLLLHEDEYNDLMNSPNKLILDSSKEIISIKGNYANPNDSLRHAYNEYVENQDYKVLIFPVEKWDECVRGKKFVYNFESGKWISGGECVDGVRYIHSGGISYGPYIQLSEGNNCRVIIEGENLRKAKLQVYSMQDGETIHLEPAYSNYEDKNISFVVNSTVPLYAMEVVISNPADNGYDDIKLYTETLEIFSDEDDL